MWCLCRSLRLSSGSSSLAILRQKSMISYKSIPSVTILRLMARSKCSTILTHPVQSTCLSENNKSIWIYKKIIKLTKTTQVMLTTKCIGRFDATGTSGTGGSTKSSSWGRGGGTGLGSAVSSVGVTKGCEIWKKQLHVVWGHLPRNYTELPYRHHMIWKVYPPVVYISTCQRITNRWWRNGLNVPKLSNHPLWSNVDDDLTPSNLSRVRGDQLIAPNSLMLSIQHPTDVGHCQGINTCSVRGSLNPGHLGLTHKPPTGMWASLNITIINDTPMDRWKVLVNPALQTQSQHQQTNMDWILL